MTLEKWVQARRPEPPKLLQTSMRDALVASGEWHNVDAAAGTRKAALRLLHSIMSSGDASRSTALHLLTADALVTYSCEAACDAPDDLDRLAAETIREVVELLEPGGAGGSTLEHGAEAHD